MKDITLEELIGRDMLKGVFNHRMEERVRNIRSGKAIKKGYAKSAKAKRKRYGLQVSHVDLTGNYKYTKKHWRFLDDWYVKMGANWTAVIKWQHALSKKLLSAHIKRYGKIFRMGK